MDTDLFTWHTESDTITDLKHGLSLAQNSGAKSLLILTCHKNHYCEQELSSLFKTCPLILFGGAFPMLTFQNNIFKRGTIIIGFNEVFNVIPYENLSQYSDEDSLEGYISTVLEESNNLCCDDNFLMFYDASVSHFESFIDCLFECLDHAITIAGGGAGSTDLTSQACIFTNHGVLSDAAILVALPKKLYTGTAQGWRILQGPFLASEAHQQALQSLNYQPAYQVYCQAIEEETDYRFTDDNFFDIAKRYPLGIEDINNNLIVRATYSTDSSHLKCIGYIPINSMVYLLEGSVETLLAATEQAITSIKPSTTLSSTMVFDCISRVSYMEEEFSKELNIIEQHCPTSTLFGVLSLGEIANGPNGAIRLLNKSTVISAW